MSSGERGSYRCISNINLPRSSRKRRAKDGKSESESMGASSGGGGRVGRREREKTVQL